MSAAALAVPSPNSPPAPAPFERLVFNGFHPTGTLDHLFTRSGLTPDGVAAAAHRALARK